MKQHEPVQHQSSPAADSRTERKKKFFLSPLPYSHTAGALSPESDVWENTILSIGLDTDKRDTDNIPLPVPHGLVLKDKPVGHPNSALRDPRS